MKIKRLLALVLTIAAFATLCTSAFAAEDKIVVANYYDTGDCRLQGLTIHEGAYGWKGGVSVAPTVERAPLDLNVKANWAKVGAVKAQNLLFVVPAQVGGDGSNILDDNGDALVDTANNYGMSYIVANIVEGSAPNASGDDYPKNQTPFITYEVKADAGKYIDGLMVTAWGCGMHGDATLEFFVTPEIPGEVTDPELKDLSVFEYLVHFGSTGVFQQNQNGNYTDSTALKCAATKDKFEVLGKKATLYVTAVVSSPATTAGAGTTGNTDGKDQYRFTGCKIEATQVVGEADAPINPGTGTPATGDALVASAVALVAVSGAAVVFATRKRKED